MAEPVEGLITSAGSIAEALGAEFRDRLVAAVAELLANDPHRLQALLYRIDVDEAQADAALAESDEALRAERLADVILARQLRKLRTRAAERRRRSPLPEDGSATADDGCGE